MLCFRFKPAFLPVFCCPVSSFLDSCLCGVCFLVRRFDGVVFVVVVGCLSGGGGGVCTF